MLKDLLDIQQLGLVKQVLLTGIIILLVGLVDNIAWATVGVVKYGSGTPVQVCQPSDTNSNCGGGGGGGSGNVGIGTVSRIPVYIGTTTIGSPYNNVMDSNGNVGIGTSTPIYALTLNDAGLVTPTGTDIGDPVSGWSVSNGGGGIFVSLASNTSLSSGLNTEDDGAGNATIQNSLVIQNVGNTNYPYVSIGNEGSTGRGIAFAANNPHNSILTSFNTIDDGANGNAMFLGNVGIGTIYGVPNNNISPIALDVQGSLRASAFTLTGNHAAQRFVLMASSSVGIGTWSPLPASGSGTVTSVATSAPLTGGTFTTSGTIGIGTVYPIITTGGNLGINTTSPWNGVPAGAVGVAPITFNTANGNIGINTTGPWNGISAGLSGVTPITFSPSSGNIGINTTGTWNGNAITSSSTATINGQITNTSPITLSGTGTSGSPYNVGINTTGFPFGISSLVVQSPLSGGTITTTGNVGIGTALGNISTFGATGNVGINSTNPGMLLDIQGTVRVLGTGGLIVNNGNVGIGTSFINGAGEGALTVMNGNVGMGTWIPAYLLDVNGSARILGSGTSDFGSNVGIGTAIAPNALYAIGTGQFTTGIISNGNIGIGTITAPNALYAVGAVSATTGFSGGTYSNQVPVTGNIITTGNIGIGTTTPPNPLYIVGANTAVVVQNNVGIGTAVASTNLYVKGTAVITGNFNVGLGTAVQSHACFAVTTGNLIAC